MNKWVILLHQIRKNCFSQSKATEQNYTRSQWNYHSTFKESAARVDQQLDMNGYTKTKLIQVLALDYNLDKIFEYTYFHKLLD